MDRLKQAIRDDVGESQLEYFLKRLTIFLDNEKIKRMGWNAILYEKVNEGKTISIVDDTSVMNNWEIDVYRFRNIIESF